MKVTQAIMYIVLCMQLGCIKYRQPGNEGQVKQISGNVISQSGDVPTQHADSLRKSREIKLANGMRVLLIHDPSVNQSGAALGVNVGSMEDPADKQGLAHLVEHAVLLASSQYTDLNPLSKFSEQNGGWSNASTSLRLTTYFFNTNNGSLDEGLRILSSLIASPTFPADAIPGAIDAVNEEYVSNKQDETWLRYAFTKGAVQEGHPLRQNTIGNAETLSGVTRDDIIAFYKQYYKAPNMTLSILSNQNLDAMQAKAAELFGSMPEGDGIAYVPQHPALEIDTSITQRVIHTKSVGENRTLRLGFVVPSYGLMNSDHPLVLLTNLSEQNAPGGLSYLLKKSGHISGIETGWFPLDDEVGVMLYIDFSLTDAGFNDIKHIYQAFHSQVKFMQLNPIPSYMFDEFEVIHNAEFKYGAPGSDLNFVHMLSRRTDYLSPNQSLTEYESIGHGVKRYDQGILNQFLTDLHPSRTVITLYYPQAQGDLIEPMMQAEYSIEDDIAFGGAAASPELVSQFGYLPQNQYVPANFELVPSETGSDLPTTLIDNGSLKVMHHNDESLKTRMAKVIVSGYSDKQFSLKDLFGMMAYSRVISRTRALDWVDNAEIAGYETGFGSGFATADQVMNIDVSGFSEKILDVARDQIAMLKNFEFGESQLEIAKSSVIETINSSGAYGSASGLQWNELYTRLQSHIWSTEAEDAVALVNSLTVADLIAIRSKLFESGRIEVRSVGNLKGSQVLSFANKVHATLGMTPKAIEDANIVRPFNKIDGGDRAMVSRLSRTNESGNGFLRTYAIEGSPVESFALSKVLRAAYGPAYFTRLRTELELGYHVGAYWDSSLTQNTVYTEVISSDVSPVKIQEENDKFFVQFLENIDENLSEEDFQGIKQAIADELRYKPTSISDYEDLYYYVSKKKLPVNYGEQGAQYLDSLTRAEFIEIFRRTFVDPNTSGSLTVHIFDKGIYDSIEYVDGFNYLPLVNPETFGTISF